MKDPAINEQRSGRDRRQNHSSFFKLYLPRGKRQALRRNEDSKRISIFDQYHPSLLIYILTVLSLSLLDAALTLTLLNKGAVELNPIMRYYISHGPVIFVMVKYGLTALPLFIMIVLYTTFSSRFRILSSLMFPSCILLFGSVVIWELYLLAILNPV